MKKPSPELGKHVSEVTSARPCEQLNGAGEEKESGENDSHVSASFPDKEWEEFKGKMSSTAAFETSVKNASEGVQEAIDLGEQKLGKNFECRMWEYVGGSRSPGSG